MTSSNKPFRILVVDDNPAIHDDFRKVFSSTSVRSKQNEIDLQSFFDDEVPEQQVEQVEYDQADAYQGKEGLEMFVQSIKDGRPFDLAFVDMRMPPGWDGLQTIKKLWEQDPDLQIVVCTAFSDYSWSDFFSQLGPQDGLLILKKPFDQAEVLQLACALTRKRHLIRVANTKMATMEKIVKERTAKLEQAHQESERMLSAISSLLIGIDAEGKINRWNDTATRLFGIKPSDALGKRLLDIPIQWEDKKAITGLLDHCTQPSNQRMEIVFQSPDGKSRFIGSSTYPITYENKWVGNLILGTDITDQKLMETQLHHAQKLEAVGQLAAGVAHEINTPMQYVGDNLEFVRTRVEKMSVLLEDLTSLLNESATDDQLQSINEKLLDYMKNTKCKSFFNQVTEAVTDSQEGVQHVSRIVRAMKEFAHPGQEEKTPVDINGALESTVAVATNEWKYVAEIETDFDSEIPLVPAMAGELNQVFLNILVNAAHAIADATDNGAEGKGTIRLSTRTVDKTVEVTIEDSGCGMAEEIQRRIFDPFFTTKEVGKGTGQGLAIAHSVVSQKHGGKLWCESTPGQGTTFFIRLPLEEAMSEDENRELEPETICEQELGV